MIKYIITHSGSAHRDEFLAIAFILAKMKVTCPIYRREPRVEELKDPEVWVIDIGKQYNEKFNNYDHHQFEVDHIPECSLSLIMKKFDLYYPEYCGWIEPSEILDCKGPVGLAKHHHIKIEELYQTMSPIEDSIIADFEGLTEILPENWMYIGLLKIGNRLMNNITSAKRQIEEAEKIVEIEHIGNIDVMFYKDLVGPATAQVIRSRKNKSGKDIVVSVMPDNRSEGWKLFRYFDDERIDFNKCINDNRLSFIHKNGFVCTTTEKCSKDILKELILKSQEGRKI